MEQALAGVPLTQVKAVVERFYAEHGVESPGLTPAHFARVVSGGLPEQCSA